MPASDRPDASEPGTSAAGHSHEARSRRHFLLGLAALAPSLAQAAATAPNSSAGTASPPPATVPTRWPRKAIRLIVPTSPGTSADRIARALADPLGRLLGQSVIAENRPGNHGNLAATLVGDAPPDGYTLLMATETMPCINALLHPRGAFNPARKLVAINQLAEAPLVLLTHRLNRLRSLTPLLRQARRNRTALNFGCQGYGSISHLAMLQLQNSTGVPFSYQPFKNTHTMLEALQTGELDLACLPADPAFAALANGQVRAIGITGSQRNELLPQVMPLAQQAGVADDYRVYSWLGLLAPVHTSGTIITQINDALIQSSRNPVLLETLRKYGYMRQVLPSSQNFQHLFTADLARNRTLIETAELKLRR